MKRILFALLFALILSGCATLAVETKPAPVAVIQKEYEPSRPCDEACHAKRRAELDRLLNLGTPAGLTVASGK